MTTRDTEPAWLVERVPSMGPRPQGGRGSIPTRLRWMPLLWRVFAGNAAVLLVATLVLVLTPATVSFPIALEELLILALGLSLMLVLDVALLRRAFAPLATLAEFARAVDPLAPGARARLVSADPEV